MTTYFIIKALHIIFIVTWFAGLFYIVRLFVYQAEAQKKPLNERAILEPQYRIMSRRLWYGITWPSFVLTIIFGPWLLYLQPGLLKMPYMHVKLGFVAGLVIYHFICHRMFLKMQDGTSTKSGTFYRIWNEVATLFLVAIVFIIVMKSAINWVYATVGFVLFGVLIMLTIKIYRKLRMRK
ncbi:MAG: CopD family protein [Crocinitomicaceae bacterium]